MLIRVGAGLARFECLEPRMRGFQEEEAPSYEQVARLGRARAGQPANALCSTGQAPWED